MQRLFDLWKRLRPGSPSVAWDSYFAPGETLVWEAGPEPDATVRWSHVGLAIFGLPFLIAGCAVSATGLGTLVSLGGIGSAIAGIGIFAFGLPFIGIGGFMVFGPWILARAAPEFVRYAITDRRVYVAQHWWRPELDSYAVPPDAVVGIIAGRADTVVVRSSMEDDENGDRRRRTIRLENIAEGQKVYHLLRDMAARAESGDAAWDEDADEDGDEADEDDDD